MRASQDQLRVGTEARMSTPLTRRHVLTATLLAGGVICLDPALPSARATPPPPGSALEVDVTDHGAVADGMTDDTPAFRGAMAELAAGGGGTLVVPAGTYLVNETVPLASDVHITSNGAVLRKTAAPSVYAWFTSVSGSQQGYGSGARNVRVDGLTFQADYEQPFTACAFALNHAQDIVVERCRFIQAQGSGHTFDLNGCRRITIRDCVFAGFLSRQASSATSECIQLDQSMPGSLTHRDEDAGMDALFTREVSVLDCEFLPLEVNGVRYPAPNPIGAHAVREGHHYNAVEFRRNRVVDPIDSPSSPEQDEANVRPWTGTIHFPAVRGLVVADNEFVCTEPRSTRAISVVSVDYGALDTRPPLPDIEHGTFAPNASADIEIRNNTFTGFAPSPGNPEQSVIWLRGIEDGHISDVVIEDNQFSQGRDADGRGTWAVHAERCRQVWVAGNTFDDSCGAIELVATSEFMVRKNTISSGPSDSSLPAVVVTDGSSHGVVVHTTASGFDPVVDTTGAGDDVRPGVN